MPLARVVKNVLYVFGGSTDGKTVTNAVWAYNPTTNKWSAISDANGEGKRRVVRQPEAGIASSYGLYLAAMPLFTRTSTSTLRFSVRPSAVSFEAAGFETPIAPGVTMCRTGTSQSWSK
jgi:Kelch motif